MNSEQIQNWLAELNERYKIDEKTLQDISKKHDLLNHETEKTNFLINYLHCNYTDIDLTQPIIACLLASYYKGGLLPFLKLAINVVSCALIKIF